MKLTWHFFETATGQLVLIGLLAAVAAGFMVWQSAHAPAAIPGAKVSAPVSLPRVFQRVAPKFEPPAPAAVPPVASAPVSKPPAPKVMPLGLVLLKEAATVSAAAPYGRMIPCETVVTLESNRLATPVVGLVTEDVWWNGRMVIPAGAEVHGRASLDRSRERIAAEGAWVIVANAAPGTGRSERRVSGIALARELRPSGEFDGSAGLKGEVVRTDNERELKLFASTFLSSATAALQEARTVAGPLGDSSFPATSVRNATLAGTGAVLREYADQMREAIARDGFYVRVPAGTPFYLYVTEALTPGTDTFTKQP